MVEYAGTVSNHPCHSSTAGHEMSIAKGITGNHAVGSNQGVVSDPFNEAEQCRSIDHLDLHQLLSGNFKDLCSLFYVVIINQRLVGGEELGRIGISPFRNESSL